MKPRQKRLWVIVTGLCTLGLMAFFLIQALRQNMVFFYSPTQLIQGEAPQSQVFRIGGLVLPGSVVRLSDGVNVRFQVTDTDEVVTVLYAGSLPDLFKEGQGVVVQGRWTGQQFEANEVLAKHDENYMPPEAQAVIDQAHNHQKESTP
ncbi:MAG: cytochrome c maturation protein CcmE [Neisseriaceae bacterium]|nr:cytochrome c maturation protein CcmE [Neisseriaceae bacterium]MBP6861425.1 cytochrome c maturation protein CcmE [Neisseriaceae bacterium]